MTDRLTTPAEGSTPRISTRKRPRQARSRRLVEQILAAAGRVLSREGASRFTAARVAEEAGISVGSLYQYFPNKAAILFQLQTTEWAQTTEMLHDILMDGQRPPQERLRAVVHAFIRSECEEAATRAALHDAAPLYRDTPEAREARASREWPIHAFMEEALPRAPQAARDLASDLISTTLSAGGKHFSGLPRAPDEIAAYADAMADMFCAYIRELERRGVENSQSTRQSRAAST